MPGAAPERYYRDIEALQDRCTQGMIEEYAVRRGMISILVLFLTVAVCVPAPARAAATDEGPTPAQALDTLPLTVRNALKHRNLPADTLSLHVYDLDSDEDVLIFNGDAPRNPASVMKLVTTLVALDVLGPAYRWRTEAWLRGELGDEVLDGDLLLKGYGDPFLVTERVWTMLRAMPADRRE